MNEMGALTISNVRKTFGHVEILKGIDIEIDAGEFLILVGPSGCGKSTLLNMIAGLDSTRAGKILIGDRVVDLRPKTFEVLRHLVANAGQLISKNDLYAAACPASSQRSDDARSACGPAPWCADTARGCEHEQQRAHRGGRPPPYDR